MKKQNTFLNQVWNALDYAERTVVEGFFGNKKLTALGCNDKLAFIKFDGEERYFTVTKLTHEIAKNSPTVVELRNVTAHLYCEYAGVNRIKYRDWHFMFSQKIGNKELYWLLTELKDIENVA